MTIAEMKKSPMFLDSLIPHGNGKLLDYTDDNGTSFRYAQFNTRPVIDCPFRSVGCEAVCYATKGNHVFPSVKSSRARSYETTKRNDFIDCMVYTIRTNKCTGRYKNSVMIIRIHESGDFYSLQYLKKWVEVWRTLEHDNGITYTLYTKSFRFFLMLNDTEKATINRLLEAGTLSINWSMDDTTTTEQKTAYLECVRTFPKANTYYCTEHVDNVEHDNVCDCADCAKCGTCNKGTGKTTVVKIHSASKADMEVYRKNIK